MTNKLYLSQEYAEIIRPMVCDTVTLLHDALTKTSSNILVEGANATMLDIDFGNERSRKFTFLNFTLRLA